MSATRFTPDGNIRHAYWADFHATGNRATLKNLASHYRFIEAAVRWAVEKDLKIAIVGNIFAIPNAIHVRELYLQLRALRIRVGAIQHDLSTAVNRALMKTYTERGNDWAHAAARVQDQLASMLKADDELLALLRMGSSLVLRPDFVITSSDWVGGFVDPLKTIPRFTLHPIMDGDHWRSRPPGTERLEPRNILMINPQGRKNPAAMSDLINNADASWTFRVLKGGWGNAFTTFGPKIAEAIATRENRVELVEYVRDIRAAYRASRLMFFPSLVEGYGMAAVEPMYSGTPVVSSNYPAVLEAVGDGANTLCPFKSTREDWKEAVVQVMEDGEYWSNRSLDRSATLEKRQAREIRDVTNFLTALL